MESNPEILLNAIYDLPLYDPDPSVWEKLETDIYPFPKHQLKLHDPKATLWSEIENSLNSKTKAISQKKIYSFVAVLIVGILGLLGYWHSFNQKDFLNTDKGNQVLETKNNIESGKRPIANRNKLITDSKQEIHEGEPVIVPKHELIIDNKNQNVLITENIDETELNPIFSTSDNVRSMSHFSIDHLSIDRMMSIESDFLITSKNDYPLNIIRRDIDCSTFTGATNRFSIAVLMGMDFISSNYANTNTSISYWRSLGAEFNLKLGRLSFSLGIGKAFSADKTNQDFTYLTNELIRSYTIVDSVYYNPETGTMEFITTNVEVYDSIEYKGTTSSINNYKYIQVPLGIGYQIVRDRKFSFYLFGKVTYLQVVSIKENLPSFDLKNSRLVDYTSNFNERNGSLFKLSLSPVFEYNLNRRFSLSVAPNFSYFTKPIHRLQNNNYSWGVDAGLHFSF